MIVRTPDGAIYGGFDAFRAMARVLPGLWPLLPFLYLPGARWIGTAGLWLDRPQPLSADELRDGRVLAAPEGAGGGGIGRGGDRACRGECRCANAAMSDCRTQ